MKNIDQYQFAIINPFTHIHNYEQTQSINIFGLIISITMQQNKDKAKEKKTVKMKGDKGILTIQTDELIMQAQFSTPILEVSDYLEQYQKFNYRSALSSINLKVNEFEKYYSVLKDRIENQYSAMVYRSVLMIHDLLVSLRFAKIELWRQQTAITNAIRTNLYLKAIDPYHFNPDQFQSDIGKVIDQLKTPKSELNRARQVIDTYAAKLKTYETEKMDDMFAGRVHQPYLAQNKDCQQVNPSSLYSSYLSSLRIRLERADETLIRRHFAIHEEILKFGKYACDHCLKYQRTASALIRKYNDSSKGDFRLVSIVPTLQLLGKRKFIDADDLSPGRQQRLESKSALANRQMTIHFAQTNRVLDLNTNREEMVQHVNEQGRSNWQRTGHNNDDKESPFSFFATARRNNPQQFFQLHEYQKQKYRQEEMRQRMRERQEKERTYIRKVIRTVVIPPEWNEFAEQQSPFIQMYFSRQKKEQHIWEIKAKPGDKNYSNLLVVKDDLYYPYRGAEEKARLELQKKKLKEAQERARQDEAILYEKRRWEEQNARLNKIKTLVQNRNYQHFIKISNISSPQYSICNNEILSRYGLNLKTKLQQNNQADVDRFFFYYFKERYFRQNEKVKENSDIPLIFLDSTKVNMNSSSKTITAFISSMLKKIQTFPFFLVWSEDLISYRLIENKEGESLNFDFYCYVNPINSQKLIYQLRKRLERPIIEKIHLEFIGDDSWQRLYSKVQIAHRLIFDRHLALPTFKRSVQKGKQIANEIIQLLCQ